MSSIETPSKEVAALHERLSTGARFELAALGLDGSTTASSSCPGRDPVPGRALFPRTPIQAPEILNEADDYFPRPSSFSRGLRVDLSDATLLFLSGTASIDQRGETVSPGDFEAQCLRTFRNLAHLLAAEGASWHDVMRTTCYLRDIERDYDTFNDIRTVFINSLGIDPLPASTGIQARLCRSDLLIEIEAIAIVPRSAPA